MNTNIRRSLLGLLRSSPVVFILFSACSLADYYWSSEAHKFFVERNDPFTVTVYPVLVFNGINLEHDNNLARRIAVNLKAVIQTPPVHVKKPVQLPEKWNNKPSDVGIDGEIFRSFGAFVAERGIETDYAILVSIVSDEKETSLLKVSSALIDSEGRIADRWQLYPSGAQKRGWEFNDRVDGCRIAVIILKQHLR